MARPVTKAITRILISLMFTLGMTAGGRHADADWWELDAIATQVGGIIVWNPRQNGYLQWNEGRPDGFDPTSDRLDEGIASRCSKLLDLLKDEKALQAFAEGGAYEQDGFDLCMVMAILHQAHPAPIDTFDRDNLISDIENRLNLKSFRSSFGPSMSGLPGPVFFGYYQKNDKQNGTVVTKGDAEYKTLSRTEGRDSWNREINLLAAADWTSDGHADLLVLYTDQALYFGNYFIVTPLILTTNSKSDLITAIAAADWIVDHREQLLEALGDQRK